MPRPVLFYRSTRPQAPKYAKAADIAHLVECSICRGMFLENDKEIKAAHRRWHKMFGDALMPCKEAHAAGLKYCVLVSCPRCTEDFCPCTDCRIQHSVECASWQAAWTLQATDELAGEAAMNAILEARRT